MLPTKMRAIIISCPGTPEVLKQGEWPCPQPKDRQILIRLHAAGVNRPDIAQRQGLYPAPQGASPLLGLEGAGEVVAYGEQSTRFALGERVMALLPGGGYAEYAVVDERHAMSIPEGMDFITAAAIPETYLTVWHNLFELGRLEHFPKSVKRFSDKKCDENKELEQLVEPSETKTALTAGKVALIHGGTSGIGTTAIQLAKAFGATVITTAGSDKKCQVCRELGADLAINYHTSDFVTVINDYTKGQGVNVILDMVGGDYVERNIKVAAVEGRLIQIAFLNGHKAQISLNLLMQKRLILTGSTLRPRDDDFKAQLVAEMVEHVLPFLKSRKIRPIIDTVLPLAKADRAHHLMEASHHIGKIILTI